MTENDAAREGTESGAASEVAAMLIKAAFKMPIGTMKAACDLQKKLLEMMEGLLPGGEAGKDGGARGAAEPPSAGAGTSASPSPGGPASTAGGWGPVTPQDQVTGWGPMSR
ncbi:MAG TPA: hypothetical protein VHQ90_24390 [Thermoanaerobaculia bacterium]|nr:hypothetical protein [Thermoanaerobaculia bacterium]